MIMNLWNIRGMSNRADYYNKKMIERRVIEKEEDGRLRDYTQYRIQPDVYEVLKPSYDQFYSIIGD